METNMNFFGQQVHWASMSNIKYCGILAIIIGICLMVRWYKSYAALQKLAVVKFRHLLIKHGSMVYKLIKIVLMIVGFFFLLLALLQPQWGEKDQKIEQAGRDILIAVDISRSMLCQDVKPNRLELAKQKIKKMLFNLSCERVGLILFSGDTVVQCPLTKDYATFFMFLDDLDVETISSGTTTIDGAIVQAINIYKKMPEHKTKLLCIFTDGEDFSTNLAQVKKQAEQEHLSIFTFGLGTKNGAPIPVLDAQGRQIGFEKDAAGNIVMSKLNDGILKNISEQTGGQYITVVSNSDTDISSFIERVKTFEKDALEDEQISKYQEQYPYFIAISLLCFAFEWLL